MKFFTFTKNKNQPNAVPKELYIWIWIHLGICIIALGILSIPLMNTTKSVQQAYVDVESKAAKNQGENTQQESKQNIDEFQNSDLLRNAIPSENNVIQFVEAFEKAAKDHGVTQEIALHSEKKIVHPDYNEIPATIRIDGSIISIVAFLKDIEQQPFYINPNTISITNQGLNNQVSMVLEIKTFWTPKQ